MALPPVIDSIGRPSLSFLTALSRSLAVRGDFVLVAHILEDVEKFVDLAGSKARQLDSLLSAVPGITLVPSSSPGEPSVVIVETDYVPQAFPPTQAPTPAGATLTSQALVPAPAPQAPGVLATAQRADTYDVGKANWTRRLVLCRGCDLVS